MIDRVYKTVQAIANKEQLGYIQPYKFNLYANNSIYNVYSKLISDVKTNVRKSNWMLDGKHLADYSEVQKQLLEHFLTSKEVSKVNDKITLPEDCEFIQDLYSMQGVRIDKVDLQDFNLLKRNNYANPTSCSPVYHKMTRNLLIQPDIDEVNISYLRKPNKAKWTFEEDSQTQKPMFDPTKDDYSDIDLPESLSNEIIVDILAQAGITIRDTNVVNYTNQEETREIQIENKQ